MYDMPARPISLLLMFLTGVIFVDSQTFLLYKTGK